jgi:hypothetical protein
VTIVRYVREGTHQCNIHTPFDLASHRQTRHPCGAPEVPRVEGCPIRRVVSR